MRYFVSLLALTFGLLAVPAGASTLTWDLPTERVNGMSLEIEEIEKVSIYRNGELYQEVPATVTSLEVPEVCRDAQWTATVTAGFTSAHSEAVVQPLDPVGCAPKPPTGLRF